MKKPPRHTIRHLPRVLGVVLLIQVLVSGRAWPVITVVNYHAGAEGNPVAAPDPATADGGSWVAGVPADDVANFQSAGVSPDGASGLNAWRMLDNSGAAGQFLTWNFAFAPDQHAAATNNGWRLAARLRVADPVEGNAGGNSIVLLYGNNAGRRWIAFFDLTPTNTLVVTLAGGSTLLVATDTNIATGYNLHEFVYHPTSGRVAYLFNGAALTTNYNGTTGTYDGVQWGTGSTAGRGDSYWNSVEFEIAEPPPLPQVLVHPQSSTNAVGDSVTFEAVFTNQVTAFQWFKDGAPIDGATGSSLNLDFVTVVDAGDYICRATNAVGFAETLPATLTVLPDETPPAVARAILSLFAHRVRVRFSEPVEPVSAADRFNYGIAEFPTALLLTASPVDRFTVDLFFEPLFQAGSNYTLVVSLVEDLAGNEIPSNTPFPIATPSGYPVLTNLLAAFDGSSAVPNPVDGVTWNDRSGNEHHALEVSADADRRPTLVSDALNGRPVLRFVQALRQNLRIDGASSVGLDGNAYTWFALVRPTSFANFPNVIRHQSTFSGANWGSFFFAGSAPLTGNQLALVSNGRRSNGGAVEAIAYPVVSNEWSLVTGYVNGPAGESFSRVEIPAAGSVVAATNNIGEPLGFGPPVGTWIGGTAGNTAHNFDGEMAALLIYSGALDEAQRSEVESFLRDQYFPPRPLIRITRDGSDVIVNFTDGLQSSPAVEGPYEDVPGNPVGSLKISPGSQLLRQFFRARRP